MSQAWDALKARISEMEALAGAIGLLEWDQQTYMPPGGAGHRSAQMGALTAILHERLSAPEVGELLAAVREEPTDPVRAAALRNLQRSHDRALRVPGRLVRELSEARAAGFHAWLAAREEASFAPFQASLERIVGLLREVVACHGPADHPYDHLLEEFDPGSTTAELRPMFDRLADELTALLGEIEGRDGPPPLQVEIDREGVNRINRAIVEAMGFRTGDGRLDVSEHPFTVGLGPHDVRLTTHFYAGDLLGSLSGTIHECGHGLYEQGLPDSLAGTTAMEAAGVGLHESQSRFWENVIGRSRQFYEWLVPLLHEEWPHLNVSVDALYGAANRVVPSFIRIHADETTYNLHIIIRFQLELALITGELAVADLPGAWDDAYEQRLGIRPPDPLQGVLQDMHWASGMFGYFPSYTIGNLYAAGFRRAMEQDIPDLWEGVARGQFGPALDWLREKVHRRGHLADPPEIFRDAVGDRDPVADLVGHLRDRVEPLYGL